MNSAHVFGALLLASSSLADGCAPRVADGCAHVAPPTSSCPSEVVTPAVRRLLIIFGEYINVRNSICAIFKSMYVASKLSRRSLGGLCF